MAAQQALRHKLSMQKLSKVGQYGAVAQSERHA